MGKGARTRAAREEENRALKLKNAKTEKRKNTVKKIKSISGTVISIVAVLAVIVLLANNALLNSGYFLRKSYAVKTENFEIDGTMMSYFFYYNYNNYLDYYGEYLSYYSTLDPTKSLKKQTYQSDTTYFDYFSESAKTTASNILVLCEAAKAAGVELSAEELSAIENRLSFVDVKSFGRGVKISDVRKCLELTALAEKYKKQIEDGIEITSDEIDKYYTENKNTYNTVKYRSYTVSYVAEDSDTEGLSQEDAKKKADKLAAATTEEEFKNILTEFFKEDNKDITDEELETSLAGTLTEKGTYTKDDKGSEWLFAESTAVSSTTVIEDTTNKKYTVYMLLGSPVRDEGQTKTVRHILFSTASYDTETGASNKAQSVYDAWVADGAKIEDFGNLALKYSTDNGSAYVGGIYENVHNGEFVTEFNDWLFSDERTVGDSDVISTSHGYHIVYYVGDGLLKWQTDVYNDMLSAEYKEIYTELETKTAVNYNPDHINKINA